MNELKKKITDYVMSVEFQDKYWPISEIDYQDDIVKMLYDITSDLWLEVEFTSCDTWTDVWIEATVYIKNLVWMSAWYNVIIDVDFRRYFDTREDFIETLYNTEQHALNLINYFNS